MSKSSSLFLVWLLFAFGTPGHAANMTASPRDGVPSFDIRAACRALARVPEARLVGVDQGDATKYCLEDERRARAKVLKERPQFKPADRNKCIGVSRQSEAIPVYSELLTCLEMARDAGQPASANGPL